MGESAQPSSSPGDQSLHSDQSNTAQSNSTNGFPSTGHTARPIVAVAVLLLVLVYAACIITGKIKPEHKLTGADAAIVVVGVLISGLLFQPQLLAHLKHFKLGSLEVELQQLQQKQEKQQAELDGVRLALTLTLQPREREILRKLHRGDTQNETGGHDLRTDLRRLSALGLTKKIGSISQIKDGQKVDLKEKVVLEDLGKGYLRELGDAEL